MAESSRANRARAAVMSRCSDCSTARLRASPAASSDPGGAVSESVAWCCRWYAPPGSAEEGDVSTLLPKLKLVSVPAGAAEEDEGDPPRREEVKLDSDEAREREEDDPRIVAAAVPAAAVAVGAPPDDEYIDDSTVDIDDALIAAVDLALLVVGEPARPLGAACGPALNMEGGFNCDEMRLFRSESPTELTLTAAAAEGAITSALVAAA